MAIRRCAIINMGSKYGNVWRDPELLEFKVSAYPLVRGWGFPSSIHALRRLGPSSDPQVLC